jgi:hypothetical protein
VKLCLFFATLKGLPPSRTWQPAKTASFEISRHHSEFLEDVGADLVSLRSSLIEIVDTKLVRGVVQAETLTAVRGSHTGMLVRLPPPRLACRQQLTLLYTITKPPTPSLQHHLFSIKIYAKIDQRIASHT